MMEAARVVPKYYGVRSTNMLVLDAGVQRIEIDIDGLEPCSILSGL